MDKYNDEQTVVSAQPQTEEVSEKEQGAESSAVSLGKFKDANALLTAYNNLQAEFTKRCQRVKELEAQIATAVDKEQSPTGTESVEQNLSVEKKDDVLKEYLKELLSRKQRAIVLDGAGVGVKTPIERPKTFEQAGQLAKELLNKHI